MQRCAVLRSAVSRYLAGCQRLCARGGDGCWRWGRAPSHPDVDVGVDCRDLGARPHQRIDVGVVGRHGMRKRSVDVGVCGGVSVGL